MERRPRDAEIFSQSSRQAVGNRLTRDVVTQMCLTPHTRRAGIAGVERHCRNALADDKTLHVGPYLDDLSTEFVPHHLARFDEGAGGVRVQVAAADATGFDANDNVVSSWLRIGDGLHPYGTNVFEDGSLHRQILSRTPGIAPHVQVSGLDLW